MKKTVAAFLMSAFCFFAADASRITDCYDFTMTVKVPRVYDNMASNGYRKYQTQKIVGEMLVSYDLVNPYETIVSFRNVENRTHKVSGCPVRYEVGPANDVRLSYMGSNRSNEFKAPSVFFKAEFWPDYNVFQKVEEDNSLLVSFSGKGASSTSKTYRGESGTRVVRRMSGYVVGTLGCGCMAYGHVSPTRLVGPFGPLYDCVTDVASVFGKWRATFNRKKSGVLSE